MGKQQKPPERSNQDIAIRVVGMHADNAIEYIHMFGLRSRTKILDNKVVQHPTRDYRDDRVNLDVFGGVVQRAWIG